MANLQPMYDNGGSASDRRNLVAFLLEKQIYALPVETIAQIIEMVTITPIPQVNHIVEGMINVRGVTVPVVNLRRHLKLPKISFGLNTPIILVQTNGRMIGLIVDQVLDVLNIPTSQITRPNDILPQELGEASLLLGLAQTSDGPVMVLDLAHLFLPHQQQTLVQAAAAMPEEIKN